MRKIIIDNVDFYGLEPMKYWQPPSSWSDERKKEETKNRIFSGEWYGAQKRDGAFYELIKSMEGEVVLIGRSLSVSGDYIDKYDHLPHIKPFVDSLPNGTVLLGEVYIPGREGSRNTTTIMNCLTDKAISRQKEDKDKCWYYIFDCLAYDGKSLLGAPAKKRFDTVENLTLSYNFIELAHYTSGAELWSNLQSYLADGYEGIVITKGDAKYEPGKRPSKTTMKVKKELKDDIDCFFTGRGSAPTKLYTGKEIENWKYWEDSNTGEKLPEGLHYKEYFDGAMIEPVTKPYYLRMYGSLEIGVLKKTDGKCTINGTVYEGYNVYPIGMLSGLADEIKLNPLDYAFKPCAVTAMQIESDTGALRHGKFSKWRPDLSIEDCTYEKIFG